MMRRSLLRCCPSSSSSFFSPSPLTPHLTFDSVADVLGASVQHGHCSSRVYVMNLNGSNNNHQSASTPDKIEAFKNLAREHHYGKIVAKVKSSEFDNHFSRSGFVEEARIPGFYADEEDAVFACFYLDAARQVEKNLDDIVLHSRSIEQERTEQRELEPEPTPNHHHHRHPAPQRWPPLSRFGFSEISQCTSEDAEKIANFYKIIYPSYPFPIMDPRYILETMLEDQVEYYAIEWLANKSGGNNNSSNRRNNIVAIASAEKCSKTRTAEMTDFGTLPAARGSSLASRILVKMEESMFRQRYRLLYSIARAPNQAMNRVFASNDYKFGGVLRNNTQISGSIESMTIWYKRIS